MKYPFSVCKYSDKALAKTKSQGFIIKDTKNNTSNRVVTIPAVCTSLLQQLKVQQLEKRLMLGTYWKGHNNVFTQDNGDYMDIGTPNKSFQRIIRRYNESHEDKLPLITFHGLRHTSATLLISQNNDIKTVSARLGHATVSTTLDIYTHALKERDEAASESIEKLLQNRA